VQVVVTNSPLAAILVADVVGYSRRMKFDETGTIAFVERAFARARRGSGRFGGRVIKTMGDGWIALFDSVSGAVDCAVVLQRLSQRTIATSELTLRISVHVGEVIFSKDEYFGHALNVAARMQALAEPGGIVVSQQVVVELDRSPRFRFEAMGHPLLKNIGDGLAVYRLHATGVRERGAVPVAGLRLHLLGNLAITNAEGEELRLASAHAAAMVGVLALEPGQPIAADRLAAMLWPDKSLSQGRAAVARTRRLVNERLARGMPNLIAARGPLLALNQGLAEIDLQTVLRALDEGSVPAVLQTAVDLPGDVLAGIGAISPTLDAWLTVRRTIWRDRIIARLESCLERHEPDRPALRAAAEVLLRMEPGHEPASMALIRHLVSRGRKEAALIEFQRLSKHLRELGARPGEAAEQLAASLRDPRPVATASHVAKSGQGVPQIAIGSFEWDSTVDRDAVEQFRTDLIANLSRFRNWAVLDILGDDPGGADYLLLARRARVGSEGRLQFRLLETRNRRIAWGEAFHLSAEDWREKQSHVIGRVASALEIYISSDRLSKVVGHVPTDIANYDDWQQGEALLLQWTPEGDVDAQIIFERLIRHAPTFALPYASLASILNVRHILRPGHGRTRGDDATAHSLALRAVELDPMDARNHLALSWSAALAGRFDQAAVHLDLATTLNPFSPTTMISAAMGYAFLGDHIRAGDILSQAVRLSPMLRSHQWCYAAAVHLLGGNAEAAEEAALRSGDQIVDNQGWLAMALVQQGRLPEAHKAFGRMKEAVSRIWASDAPCDAAAVHDWFVSAYPIRLAADRAAIAEAMAMASGDARLGTRAAPAPGQIAVGA
jgi:class 3 adenylate cyclase/DNA-binding SARP family transcriptional activator